MPTATATTTSNGARLLDYASQDGIFRHFHKFLFDCPASLMLAVESFLVAVTSTVWQLVRVTSTVRLRLVVPSKPRPYQLLYHILLL